MKKLFIFLLAFCTIFICLASNSLQAQQVLTPKTRPFSLGFFAGLNYTNSFVDSYYFKSQAGLLAGIDMKYRFTNQTSLHMQPSWTQVAEANAQSNVSKLSLNTFKLPFVYRYYVSPNRNLFFVQAGLSYNYLTSSNFRKQYDFVCITAPCPNIGPNTPSSNKSTVSGIAGVGVTIELQKISIPVTLQYERYFGNYLFTTNSSFISDGNPTRVKFESFALTTGINF
ncbi:PorT family protein [Spirosoma sp. RP8]|uniref:PorT family protein n=1 Tax=Spirosoma liriopis TaxID=2937440 RepID=A0ABT0HSW6_9BACT|nr:outer membrane beta-barrel protein [Spirosoma liriopis]MCK8495261.1 PorT family protein [Spirosoma liriopis]